MFFREKIVINRCACRNPIEYSNSSSGTTYVRAEKMDLFRPKKLFALLILAGVGILATGYYLRPSFVEMNLRRKRVKHNRLLSTKNTHCIIYKDILDVQSFVFFVGYPRSSHSVLASLIDGHPNAIIAHEFGLFSQLAFSTNGLLTNRTLLYDALYQNSHYHSTQGWRSHEPTFQTKGYSLQLNGSWQGNFRHLRVIGDKSGGLTSRMYHDQPDLFTLLYQQLSRLVKVPLKVIHVVRNPYDMIATRLLYRFSNVKRQKANYSSEHPLNCPLNMSQAMKRLFEEAKAVLDMSQALNLSVLEVHNVNLVKSPRGEMRRVCKFLGLQCTSWYVDLIAKNMLKSVSVTRKSLVWPDKARDFIDTQILSLPFFQRYSFDSPH